MRPLVRPPVICGILLTIEMCPVGPARNLRAGRGASMWRTTSRTSTPSPTCRSQLECATTSPAFSFQADAFQDILDYQAGGAGPLLSVLCAFMWFTKVRLPPQDEQLRRKAGRASALCFVTCGTVSYTHLTLPTKRIV